MRMKSVRYVVVALIIAIVLYVVGGFLGTTCVHIGDCKGCWKTVNTRVNSSLCPTNEPCVAEPYQQQRNAVVDVILCACAEAAGEAYANAELNEAIENLHNLYFPHASVSEICSGQTGMSKLKYF